MLMTYAAAAVNVKSQGSGGGGGGLVAHLNLRAFVDGKKNKRVSKLKHLLESLKWPQVSITDRQAALNLPCLAPVVGIAVDRCTLSKNSSCPSLFHWVKRHKSGELCLEHVSSST